MRCKATKRDGSECTLPARDSNGFCWAHDPANAQKRRETASKGGKSRTGGELSAIKRDLRQLADDVLEGKQDKGRAAVAAQLFGVLIRANQVELKAREVEELEKRIEQLERAAEERARMRGGRTW